MPTREASQDTISMLSTAVQYQLPVIWVVLNDGALGMVRHHQVGREISSTFAETDHGAVARGMGAWGVQGNDSRAFAQALRDAAASGQPAVIDVIIDRGPSPDDWRLDARGATET